MATVDLNSCFPEAEDGSRSPLPKQQIFLDNVLQTPGKKYTRYVGGIGSGKTLIGCIGILSMAVMHPGDYLIARQFMPELRDTTYRTFLEICPEELIHNHQVANAIVQIKSSNGKISNVLFRALEEPDKLRSLNLNAFYIDECNQVSEKAFTLLQGRLRGKYWRKGILTQNSGGHDWSWRWFVKKDMFKSEKVKEQFANIVAPSTENVHLPDGYVETMLDTWDEARIQREIYANEDSFEGQVYHEFREDVHVIQPFKIPEGWQRVVGADHGYRNPACWLWGARDGDGNVYIYREFYNKEWLIDEICKGKKDSFGHRMKDKENWGVVKLNGEDKFDSIQMDPSTKAQRGLGDKQDTGAKTVATEWQEYEDNLPESWHLEPANNKITEGINHIKTYLKVRKDTGKPRVFIFSNCVNLINEVSQYRYEELTPQMERKSSEKETPVKKNDHACDAWRYLMRAFPEIETPEIDYYDRNKVDYNSLEGRLHRDIEAFNSPEPKDPFEGFA